MAGIQANAYCVHFMSEIFNGNLKQILSLFYALSRFKQHVQPADGSRNSVTSSVNANQTTTSSQSAFTGPRDQQLLHNRVKARWAMCLYLSRDTTCVVPTDSTCSPIYLSTDNNVPIRRRVCSLQIFVFISLDSKGKYSATSNNTKLVHWALMGGLLHLVQRGGAWAGCSPAQFPPRCTKCNSSPISGQCTNHRIAAIWWSVALRF